MIADYIDFIQSHSAELVKLLSEHVIIILLSIAIAVPVGVVIGILLTFNERAATVVLWLASIMQTIPSIALFGLLIPIVGIGLVPVVISLVLYSQLPVISNTYIGLTQVNPEAVKAGRGLGMTTRQLLYHVQLPMSIPVIMAGIRNTVVLLIGVAAIGAFIGAGGLGDYLFDGIRYRDLTMIVVTTILLLVLSLIFDQLFKVIGEGYQVRKLSENNPSTITQLVMKVIP